MVVVASALKAAGTEHAFAEQLHDTAARLDTADDLPDYATRRDQLRALTEIPQQPWQAICKAHGIYAGKANGKCRHAASWLWTELTQGDAVLAPGLKRSPPWDRVAYRDFVRRDIPLLRSAVLAWAARDLLRST